MRRPSRFSSRASPVRAPGAWGQEAPGARGLTLVELILALGLFSILMVAVFQLFDGSLSLWRRGETQRALLEQASAVGEVLAHDLRSMNGGLHGDLLAEWVAFDTDADGVNDTRWPRLRLVRHASAAELARSGAAPGAVGTARPDEIEVLWCVTPASSEPDRRAEGLLWRGQRPRGGAGDSFFGDDFFPRSGTPPPGSADEVSGGVLWLAFAFASQTSVVHDGWSIGSGLADAQASWDAWGLGRPDRDVSEWNEPSAGMPSAREHALLPRRVRVELEIERPEDVKRRARLAEFLPADEVSLVLDDGRRIGRGEDAHVRVGGEWMRVRSVDGNRLVVERGVRGTEAVRHDAGVVVHQGQRLVREVPVALYREDWDL
jgi:hypothetical protein